MCNHTAEIYPHDGAGSAPLTAIAPGASGIERDDFRGAASAILNVSYASDK